jgi:general secretion pathway protein G
MKSQRPTARHRSRRDKRLEGMTLVEIMIVVIIMATIAAAVGVAVVPKLEQARVKSAETGAQRVAGAAASYVMLNVSAGCPTVQDLVDTGELSRNKSVLDPWDQPFEINCDGPEPTAASAGPDRQMGTEDDIRTGG